MNVTEIKINPELLKKINPISIDIEDTLLSAIKKMDLIDKKLLIVRENGAYKSLISIGDIQRHIIRNQSLDASVGSALRKNVKVCSENETSAAIKDLMLTYRSEFMPVIDDNGELKDVVFWEDIFDHAHESLSNDLKVPVVIMAGGLGTRLKPITNIIPKPLLPLGEKPIIEIIVDKFRKMGANEFYFSVNYKAEMIQQYFEKLTNDYTIDYLKEEKPLGTAGSLIYLRNKIHSTFFVTNCDIIINQDYKDIYDYHKENKNEITLVGALKHYKIPYGTLEVEKDGLLETLKEKPELTFMVNAGMYILEPHLLEEIPEGEFFHITYLIDKIKNRNGRVGVFPVSEKSWSDIGEWKEYLETQKIYEK